MSDRVTPTKSEHAMNREFASLTPQEGLHVAIFIEERNAQLYRQFAELFAEFKDPESLEIASVFVDMAQEERSHGEGHCLSFAAAAHRDAGGNPCCGD